MFWDSKDTLVLTATENVIIESDRTLKGYGLLFYFPA